MINQLLQPLNPSRALVPLSRSPDPRVPCGLVPDRSSSMAGPKIAQLNAAMAGFGRFVKDDELTAANTEFAVVGVGGGVRVEVPFTPAAAFAPPVLEAGGDTPLGAGLMTALRLLDDRLAVYREHDIEHHVPWLMAVTDGEETADHRQFAAAGDLIRRLEAAGKLRFYAVGVDGADMGRLRTLTTRRPYKLRGLAWKEFFGWLYRSMRTVSRTRVGDDFEPESPFAAGWAE